MCGVRKLVIREACASLITDSAFHRVSLPTNPALFNDAPIQTDRRGDIDGKLLVRTPDGQPRSGRPHHDPRNRTHGQAGRRCGGRHVRRDRRSRHRRARAKPRPGIDFFPLVVDFVEKTSAAGKIPGGFFKREARLSDREVLVCRFIDRSIRPLFPATFNDETQIVATVL